MASASAIMSDPARPTFTNTSAMSAGLVLVIETKAVPTGVATL
jgi:hypothetical protein